MRRPIMPEPIEDWVDAALVADVIWMRSARAIVFVSPSRSQVRAMIEAAAPLIAAAEREQIAARMDELAANYPEDVFPPDSDVRDGISGTAMRHAYSNAARTV